MNRWLKDYAAQSGSVYLDYYSALAEGRAMKKDLTVDGLIRNDAGYEVMAPPAQQAIVQAVGKTRIRAPDPSRRLCLSSSRLRLFAFCPNGFWLYRLTM